jgi:lipoteichoic acid synthase
MEDVLLAYSFCYNIYSICFDISALLLVFLLLTRARFNTAIMLTFITSWLWSFANVFYIRFFEQYLTLSAFSFANQLTDQAVVTSMMAGFQWTDLYYPISLLCFLQVYRQTPQKTLSIHQTAVLAFIPLFLYLLCYPTYYIYHITKSDTRGNNELLRRRFNEIWDTGARNSFPNKTRFDKGSVRMLAWEVYDVFHQFKLQPEQKVAIDNEVANLQWRVSPYGGNCKAKNVVFLVLESFLSNPIGMTVEGKEITPYLNTLIKNDSVYYNARVKPNITIGESGDGQFILMTGILPLRGKLTVGEVKDLTIPALPQLLRKRSSMRYSEIATPSPPQIWEQVHMNQVYGIDTMYCNRDVLGPTVDYLNDEQLFTLAMRSPAHMRQPFFSMVLSYSTHQPYREPVDDSFTLRDETLPKGYKNYLVACHYTDFWLKTYIEDLKRKNVYDNSLIIITADHHAHLDALGMEGKIAKDLPLLIINGNMNVQQAWKGEMNQLDIYTTIVDLLGLETDWHGLGHSILFPDYENSVTEHAWELSEWIIKGKYFNQK